MYNMYNANDKNNYIEYKKNTAVLPQNYLIRLFDRTCEYESRYGKDVSNFSVDQIIDMYKSMNIFQIETLTNINSQLGNYTQWCLENSLVNDSQNHYSEFSYASLRPYVNVSHVANGIITKKEFLSYLRKLSNASDKFILLCIFEGIRGVDYSEVRQIKIEDFNGNILHLQGGRIDKLGDYDRYIKVSDDLLSLVEEANVEMSYEPYTGNKPIPLANEGFIVKRTLIAYNKGTLGNFYRRVDNILEAIRTKMIILI